MPASSEHAPHVPALSLGRRLGFVLAHALLPLCGLALIAGTLVWGPFVGLGLTAIAWRLVTRLA